MLITDDHLDRYLTHGYAIVQGFLSSTDVQAARDELLGYYPSADELEETPNRYGGILEDPERLQTEFPFDGDALNDVSTHPDVIAFVETVLGTRDVLLSQAAIWAKYAGTGDFEQGMHLDYQGNTLVVPRDDGDYRQVNVILYYTDVTADLGPTCVVSKTHTANLPLWPTFRTRKKHPELYAKEHQVIVPAGSLLLFGMRTWHRASAMTAESGERFSHHMIWRAARHGFQGYHHWPQFGEKAELQQFIARATPRQRDVLGFPRPGDPYWNDETLTTVALRYPEMDMTPYRIA